ncbi:MAG TPA: hypothetical protein VGP93_17730 [Polyangiaceae bacterium]|nr:hypothetical protein [Polyangiaceae bacterium]
MTRFPKLGSVLVCALLGANVGCSADSGSGSRASGGGTGGSGGTGGKAAGGATSGGAAAGGSVSTGGSGTGGSTSGGTSSGGVSSGGTSGGGSGGTGGPLPPDPCIAAGTCPAGEWINVTPSSLVMPDFGGGPIVADPDTASDLYFGGGGDGLWKSTDYGNTWTNINAGIGYVPMGYIMAVFPGTPTRIIVAGYKNVHKSTDGGATFTDVAFDFPAELYSIQIDPYDSTHLISGLHEADGIVESTDSGDSWNYVGTTGFPTGGKSWFVFFIDTGSAATTHDTWFAIAQDGGSATKTVDAGGNWATPTGLTGLQHVHGNAQIFQSGSTIFVPGINGPGQGLYKSTDTGGTFTKVLDGNLSVAWGTANNVYTMWGWACSGCDLGASFAVAPMPAGTTFDKPTVPDAMNIGANHVAVTSDGTHNIFVGMMWKDGVWRYVEP